MPQMRDCDYCGADIEPGTGTMLVKTDGTTIHFCSSKCENNADLGREARNLGWTESGYNASGQKRTDDEAAVEEAEDEEAADAAPDLEAAEAEAETDEAAEDDAEDVEDTDDEDDEEATEEAEA